VLDHIGYIGEEMQKILHDQNVNLRKAKQEEARRRLGKEHTSTVLGTLELQLEEGREIKAEAHQENQAGKRTENR
jgi:hypothetical protein